MQYSQTNTNTRKEDMSQVTMRKGFWFYFEHEGHDISVHGSAWSGKETVYVNNHPVSQRRNLASFTGEHHFDVNDKAYRVVISVESVWKGIIKVSLYQGNELIAEESKAYVSNSKKMSLAWLIAWTLFGAILGYSSVSYLIPLFFG